MLKFVSVMYNQQIHKWVIMGEDMKEEFILKYFQWGLTWKEEDAAETGYKSPGCTLIESLIPTKEHFHIVNNSWVVHIVRAEPKCQYSFFILFGMFYGFYLIALVEI